MRKRYILLITVLVLAGVSGLGYGGYRMASGLFSVFGAVVEPVREMHAAMNGNRDAEAYGHLSDDLRARVDPGEFEREFRAQRIWGDAGSFSFSSRSISGPVARIRGAYTRADGSVLPVFVELVKERGEWHISRFHFGAPPPGQEEWEV